MTTTVNAQEEKKLAALEAVKLVQDGQTVGLGTGSSVYFAIVRIGELIKEGWQIQGVPTSSQTEELAKSLGIPLLPIGSVDKIDLTIDGADEFTMHLDMIKGGGGALLREKVVARLSEKVVIVADSTKKVDKLGKFRLPIEVLPFAAQYVIRQLEKMKGTGQIRQKESTPYISDQGNYIIDADFGLIETPYPFASALKGIDGVVGHGLFLGVADQIIMGKGQSTVVFNAQNNRPDPGL